MTPLELLPVLFDTALLASAAPANDAAHAAVEAGPQPGELFIGLRIAVVVGLVSVALGMLLCMVRLWRGPDLADRVLASDVFALHVVAMVILLTIYLGDLTFFDAVLGVAIIGFASTVGFAQYIGAPAPPGSSNSASGSALGSAPGSPDSTSDGSSNSGNSPATNEASS